MVHNLFIPDNIYRIQCETAKILTEENTAREKKKKQKEEMTKKGYMLWEWETKGKKASLSDSG